MQNSQKEPKPARSIPNEAERETAQRGGIEAILHALDLLLGGLDRAMVSRHLVARKTAEVTEGAERATCRAHAERLETERLIIDVARKALGELPIAALARLVLEARLEVAAEGFTLADNLVPYECQTCHMVYEAAPVDDALIRNGELEPICDICDAAAEARGE